MTKLRLLTLAVAVLAVAVAAHAQSFSPLYNFGTNSGDPANPSWFGVFAQGRDGNLYSTTPDGGAYGHGAVFQLTPTGNMNVVYSFTGNNNPGGDGGSPTSGLTLGFDGNLYGIALGGGVGWGNVFKITIGGTFTHALVHSFNGTTEGAAFNYTVAPIQGKDGNFYGTVSSGGLSTGGGGGTLYKMTPSGGITVLYRFGVNGSPASSPFAIVQGADGNFYGTCKGLNGPYGGVFKITPSGKLTVLHAFNNTDGNGPYGPIIQASDGNLYGTTIHGGSRDWGVIYKVTPTGQNFQVLVDISNASLGTVPWAGLVQATDGNFYGAASVSGAFNVGVLFQSTGAPGNYSVLHNFSGTAGARPSVSLFQHTNGVLYSDTYNGGTGAPPVGVLYSLDMGLHPFVSLMTTSGKAGQTVQILGNGLTGTTSVKFGTGSATTFKVVSDTYMTAVVPATGTTGAVTVAAPSGTRVSSKTFRVLPVISSFSPTSGPVGSSVVITGTGLTQTSQVTFGGVKATFTVNSATQVTATVPTAAVTGKIKITTPGGTATSAATFTVI